MTRKRRRLYLVVLAMLSLGTATALMLTAFEDNLLFFFSPSDLMAKGVEPGQRLRLGGLVEEGSIARDAVTAGVSFRITDTAETVTVRYTGILPDLFREGQGVIVQGRLAADGSFDATEVLAKHDENYMPPEVAAALKQAGHLRDGTQ
ncbi:MAG: cytochrome c maturation protein CcmE [Alphaproteobacteria bacterium]